MSDWTKPDLSSTKANFPGECRALATNAVKLNPSSDTNIPTGAIYYDRTKLQLGEYNGSSFVDFLPKLQTVAGTGTTQGAAAAIAAAPLTIVSSSASAGNTGIKMPDLSGSGRMIAIIINASATGLNVYPFSGGNFENVAANSPLTIAAHSSAIVFNYSGNSLGKVVSA